MKLDDAPGKDDGHSRSRARGGERERGGHVRRVCEHGVTISQCRCIHYDGKPTVVDRPCPFGAAHQGLTVVHPLPPASAVGTGLGQVSQQPSGGAQLPAGAPETPGPVSQVPPGAQSGAEGAEELSRLDYLEAIERYARDPEFHARAKRIEHLIVTSESGRPTQDSRVGMWIGAAVALHLVEQGKA